MLRLVKGPAKASSYDVLIVGSGLSGCLTARRILEKKPTARIAIIEEGSLPATGVFAEAPFFAPYIPKLPWTRQMCAKHGARHGRVVGGSCTIAEGPFFVRGLSDEYEDVAKLYGSDAFRNYAGFYKEVMGDPTPSNRRMDTSKGLVPRVFPTLTQLNSDVNSKFQLACLASSLRPISDPDGECDGFAPTQALLTNGRRFMPTDLVRDYNVDLYIDTFAKQLVFDGEKVSGLSVRPAGDGNAKAATTMLGAAEVVLCAGGVGTPSLLLRSGVGPSEVLGDACRLDLPALGQSVIEGSQMQVDFAVDYKFVTRSMVLGNYQALRRSWREYKSDREGAFASFAEWQVFVSTNDELFRPNCRMTLSTALHNGLPSAGDEGFTVNIDLAQTAERGKIVPLGSITEDAADREVQYQYSYSAESSLATMDEAVLWSTMLCDSSSEIRYRDAHPFAQFRAFAHNPSLGSPETTKELIRAMSVGSGDVYGACPMGEVCDPNTLQVKGLSNVRVGDVSVIPIPMLANKLALGQVTACMAAEGL